MTFADLLAKYWWFFLIVAGLLLFWMYSRLSPYTKLTIRKMFSGKILVAMSFFGLWYFWHKYGSITSVSDANRWMPVIFFSIMMGYYYLGKLRYETQQIVTPNFHGSFSKPPFKVNGFYIFLIDTFNAGGLSWDYADRLLILREETCELLPFGAVSIANVSFSMQHEINEDVWAFINSNKFCKNGTKNVYYGWFDDIERVDWEFEQLKRLEEEKSGKRLYNMVKKELGVDNPKVSTLLWLYRNQSKAVNKQTTFYDATIDSVEKGVEHQKRTRDAYLPDRGNQQQTKSEGYEDV